MLSLWDRGLSVGRPRFLVGIKIASLLPDKNILEYRLAKVKQNKEITLLCEKASQEVGRGQQTSVGFTMWRFECRLIWR